MLNKTLYIPILVSVICLTGIAKGQTQSTIAAKDKIRRWSDLNMTNKNLGIGNIENSDNVFEIRFYTGSGKESHVKIIASKDGNLSATHIISKYNRLFYPKTLKPETPKITSYSFKDKNLDSIFFQLVANNVFTLPDMSSLVKEGYINSFGIQTKTDGKIREFAFEAPWDNNHKGIEFRNYAEIVKLFNLLNSDKIEN